MSYNNRRVVDSEIVKVENLPFVLRRRIESEHYGVIFSNILKELLLPEADFIE
jgi:hypothetical protein